MLYWCLETQKLRLVDMSGIWDLGPRVNWPLLYILLSEDMVVCDSGDQHVISQAASPSPFSIPEG
jgi:hypothetical protein